MNSLGLSISRSRKLYDDVIDAWTSTLTTTKRLLRGEPHLIQHDAILLTLKSWHLYPDMLYLPETRKIQQSDSLLSSDAFLTVGMTSSSPNRAGGLTWSLPLAYLRYYGDPVVVTRSTAVNASRLDMREFEQVVIGSALGSWCKTPHDFGVAVQFIVCLCDFLAVVSDDDLVERIPLVRSTEWLQLLFEAAKAFTEASEFERASFSRLTKWARSSSRPAYLSHRLILA